MVKIVKTRSTGESPETRLATRFRRLMDCLIVVQSGVAANVGTLAEVLRVSRRTVFRDFKVLRDAGYEIEYSPSERKYVAAMGPVIPVHQMTADEALSLAILCRCLGDPESGIPFQQAATTAGAKIVHAMKDHQNEDVQATVPYISIRLSGRPLLADRERIFRAMVESIRRRQQIRIAFRDSQDRTTSTLLSPYQVVFQDTNWYVIARSSLHRKVKAFDLRTIEVAEMTDFAYSIPARLNVEKVLQMETEDDAAGAYAAKRTP